MAVAWGSTTVAALAATVTGLVVVALSVTFDDEMVALLSTFKSVEATVDASGDDVVDDNVGSRRVVADKLCAVDGLLGVVVVGVVKRGIVVGVVKRGKVRVRTNGGICVKYFQYFHVVDSVVVRA